MSYKLLVINGSPRKDKTSFSFARTLKALAEDTGNTAEIIHAIDIFDGRLDITDAFERIGGCDILALAAPLYVDTLPYPAVWLLEGLCAQNAGRLTGKSFFAVGQCGFPDVTRCEPLLNTCRLFAAETGMKWRGGLAYGGGAILDGAKLEDLGKRGEKLIEGFRLALEAVSNGDTIPDDAQALLTLKVPRILLRPLALFLNSQSQKQARSYGTDIYSKAYI